MGLWDMPAKHEMTDTELRFNPYHDPVNGRFTSSSGDGGSFLYVGKGQKGKGFYVFDRDIDAEYEQWKQAKASSGLSAADKAIREASGGVILSDSNTVVNATMTKKNSKASAVYDKTVMSAKVDKDGNVILDYASGVYDGKYGDPVQNVTYTIKAGVVDGAPVNMDLTKATSISGKNTYSVREAAKEAGMKWSPSLNAYVNNDHPIKVNTKVSSDDLKNMSDIEIDKIYSSAAYKTLASKGHSVSEINSRMTKFNAKSKTRAEKISTIEKFNASALKDIN